MKTDDFQAVRRSDGRIEILDEEGEIQFTIRTTTPPENAAIYAYCLGFNRGESAGRAGFLSEAQRLFGIVPASPEADS